MFKRLFHSSLLVAIFPALLFANSRYRVGTGIHDITGPASNLPMNGYVKKEQTTAGIHMRLHARAFIVSDSVSEREIALVNVELCNVYDGIKEKVIRKLQSAFGNRFTHANVHIASNHTHSGPGAYSHHNFYSFRAGFSQANVDIIVEGIYQSVAKAAKHPLPARLFVSEGELLGGNVNRSPHAYLRNPRAERLQYDGNTDTTMTVLGFETEEGKPLGAYTWYPVHNTSMDNTNRLISPDNKGIAAYLWEKSVGRDYRNEEGFTAAFANSNAGDVSPGIGGDVDGNGDWECAANDNFSCTKLSGKMQFLKAREIFDEPRVYEDGALDYRHAWVDFSRVHVLPPYAPSRQVTCSAAIGVSMLAGSEEDGPGIGKEGVNCQNAPLLLKALCLRDKCHSQKPVVLQTGKRGTTPQVLPLQIIRIGSLAIVGVPAELTTMSGRRVRNTIKKTLEPMGISTVVIGGYANSYASYVATREEYDEQDYEGASTHFGPWTLNAYQQELDKLALSLFQGIPVKSPGKAPKIAIPEKRVTPIIGSDRLPAGGIFGKVLTQPKELYLAGETIEARFIGGQLSNNPFIQDSYLEVQQEVGTNWEPVAFDWDYETRLHWLERAGRISHIKVEWLPNGAVPSGVYRIVHRGVYRSAKGRLVRYEGVTRAFDLLSDEPRPPFEALY